MDRPRQAPFEPELLDLSYHEVIVYTVVERDQATVERALVEEPWSVVLGQVVLVERELALAVA